ncbi:MAG: beta-ketoacyl-[acyl-carrier-protein] synthase family protein [Phycisphaerales bacterium]|nr:beta-ketoacyl-[acyl-carrier-protein] synthase family protein [Phycisphaerales bacterium]
MQRRRVVLTGLGPATAFGLGIDPLWAALLEGRSALAPLRAFDASGFRAASGAELPASFDVKEYVLKSYRKATKVMARDIEIAVAAALTAVRDAGLTTRGTDPEVPPTIAPNRFGCQIGAGLIAAELDELTEALWSAKGENKQFDAANWGTQGMQNLTPLWLLKYLPNMLACHVTIIHDCQGPSNTITCNEASSGLSLAESQRVIERGAADACLSGGADSKLNPMAYLRQELAGRLAICPVDADATTIIRPFDASAAGTLVGEGGGILVLEALDTATLRGARVLATLSGTGASQSYCEDTVGLVPGINGESLADAIEAALHDAQLQPGDIDAAIPYGCGVAAIDAIEADALVRVFGARAATLPLVTLAPCIGATVSGFGAIAVAVAAKCVMEQRLPARLNSNKTNGVLATAAPSQAAALRHVLVFTPSLGGQNSAAVISKFESNG